MSVYCKSRQESGGLGFFTTKEQVVRETDAKLLLGFGPKYDFACAVFL